MTAIQLLAGLIYLLLGGDLLVRGAVSLADRWGLSPVVVGATIVAIGTSAPELVISVQAAITGHPGIALGNVAGSNIANMLLVIGALAVACPIGSEDETSRSAARAMLAATALLVALAWDGELTRIDGFVVLAGLPLFLGARVRQVRVGQVKVATARDGRIEWVLGHPARTWLILVFLVVGGLCLPIGASLLVESAQTVALRFGLSETIIASTIIAAGTSLPELATVLVAAARRQVDVAIGNAIGSNVFNITAVMGFATVSSPLPIPVPESYRFIDWPVLVASAVVVAAFALSRAQIRRPVGIALVSGYVAYVGVLYLMGPRL